MARIRSVKPEFWTDGTIVQLSPWARLLYIGSWNFACDHGHLPDDPTGLKLKILPADPIDPAELVNELVTAGRMVRRTTVDGRRFLHIPRLSDHQKVDARWQSKCPYCSTDTAPDEPPPPEPPPTSPKLPESRAGDCGSPPSSAGKGKDGIGEEEKTSSSLPRKRGSRIPDDFTVTADMVAWAQERCPHVDGRRETEKFVNYWRAKSGKDATKIDWEATWRNWMLNAAERQPRASPNGVVDRRQQAVNDQFDRAMQRAAAREEAASDPP